MAAGNDGPEVLAGPAQSHVIQQCGGIEQVTGDEGDGVGLAAEVMAQVDMAGSLIRLSCESDRGSALASMRL